MTEPRPHEPAHKSQLIDPIHYRGWDIGYNPDMDFWTPECWDAYKGGCDLGAPRINGRSWSALLDEIDDAEDEA